MKRISLITIILMMITLQTGLQGCTCKGDDVVEPHIFIRLLEDQSFQSTLLKRNVNYAVLLPVEYDTAQGPFPVIYLLHGFGEDEKGWYKWGNIKYYADLYKNETGPAIYVMPAGGNSYWINNYTNQNRVMDMVVNELVTEIDSKYRTIKDPASRAVMGYSMGGYGALALVAKNPEIFNTAVVLSMSFRTDSQYMAEPQKVFDEQWGVIFGGRGKTEEERITDYFLEYSPFHFFLNENDPSHSGQNYFIDCGKDEETLTVTNNELHQLLVANNIKHEFRSRDGAHTWDYWHKSLPEALKYIGFAFRKMPYNPTGSIV
ncbi:MAG: alpha/beta hydrolase [Omnitrophica WOR_2 bacterium]